MQTILIGEKRVWRLRSVETLLELSELRRRELTVALEITELLTGPVLILIGELADLGRWHLALNGELRLAGPLGELAGGLRHRERLLLGVTPETLEILRWEIPLVRHLALELVKIIGWRVAVER